LNKKLLPMIKAMIQLPPLQPLAARQGGEIKFSKNTIAPVCGQLSRIAIISPSIRILDSQFRCIQQDPETMLYEAEVGFTRIHNKPFKFT